VTVGFLVGGAAIVIGANGGIGRAFMANLMTGSGAKSVIGLGRTSEPTLDLLDEASIQAAADWAGTQGEIRLIVDATGILHGPGMEPEKSWRALDPSAMAQSFAVNAIGPALLMKHFLPLLPRTGKSVFATLSAKVGSIGDNHLGGWYSYRASKAALNQLVRTAAIELKRGRPDAICAALHPGTVDTGLSAPFAKAGLEVQTAEEAVHRMLMVIDGWQPADSGGFFTYRGEPLPW
jgi:NAD(P)-dependent dehydrogenase (short-subunit alcohol dehydrogenase family)